MAKKKDKAAAGVRQLRSLLLREMRRADGQPDLSVLYEIIGRFQDGAQLLTRLAAYDADKRVAAAAMSLLLSAASQGAAGSILHRSICGAAGRALVEALHDPDLADDRKAHLGPVAQMLGVQMSDDEYRSCFRDFDGAMERARAQYGQQVSWEPDNLWDALEFLGVLGRQTNRTEEAMEQAFGMLVNMMEVNEEAGAAGICVTAVAAQSAGVCAETVQDALEFVASHPNRRVCWFLRELGRWPGCGPAAEKAARAFEQMRAGGTEPACLFVREFSHAYVTALDSYGTRTIYLFFRTPEGGMDSLSVLCNDVEGILAVHTCWHDAAEIDEDVHDASHDVPTAHCSLETALSFLGHALSLHEGLGTPPPAELFIARPYLGEAPLALTPRKPNLGCYMLELLTPSPELVTGSRNVADDFCFDPFLFRSEKAFDFVRAHAPERGKRLSAALQAEFLREIAEVETPVLLRRMALNLEVEAMAGRAPWEINQAAARTWLALSEKIVPFEDVPYVRALARRSISWHLDALRKHYKSAAEAIAAERPTLFSSAGGYAPDETDEADEGDDGY